MHGVHAKQRLNSCLSRIRHRGPDSEGEYHNQSSSFGFTRLAINDLSAMGKQPYRLGRYVSVVNGEVFNAPHLKDVYSIDTASDCDSHVVPHLFEKFGSSFLSLLDGFFSGLIYDSEQGKLYSMRDHIGKKPLFIGRSGSEVFLVSELKAIDKIDSFEQVPLGVCEINLDNCKPKVLYSHEQSVVRQVPKPCAESSTLKALVEQAVLKRLPYNNDPAGVFISGGLDSSIIASIVAKKSANARYYCLADKGSKDYKYAIKLAKFLGIARVQFVSLPSEAELDKLISDVVFATHSYNPSIISNGICTFLLAKAAHDDGLKVVLTGEGADELFGGYHQFYESEPWAVVRQQLISDMPMTELRRVDLASMAHSIECRCPFLDKRVVEYSNQLDYAGLYYKKDGGLVNKYALRLAFSKSLPSGIAWRKKTSFDVGSGIRAMVVQHLKRSSACEKEALKKIWNGFFAASVNDKYLNHPYFHSYPVFDKAIAARGADHR